AIFHLDTFTVQLPNLVNTPHKPLNRLTDGQRPIHRFPLKKTASYLWRMNLGDRLQHPVFQVIGRTADQLGVETYAVGGYVRDLLLGRESKDIDFVAVGSGIELAQSVAKNLGPDIRVTVFK